MYLDIVTFLILQMYLDIVTFQSIRLHLDIVTFSILILQIVPNISKSDNWPWQDINADQCIDLSSNQPGYNTGLNIEVEHMTCMDFAVSNL